MCFTYSPVIVYLKFGKFVISVWSLRMQSQTWLLLENTACGRHISTYCTIRYDTVD